MRLLHEARDFLVDSLSGFRRVILGVAIVAAQENFVVRLAERLLAQRVGHAVVHDHLAGHLRGALQVVARAGRDVAAEDFLGNATAQEHGEFIVHLVSAHKEFVLVGNRHGVAQRAAARHDGDLMHRIGVRQQVANQGMARFVERNGATSFLVHHAVLALGAGHQALHGLVDLGHGDVRLVAASGEQRGFVHEVHEVGAGHAARELRDARQVDIGTDGLVLRVHRKNLLAAANVGRIDHDLAVETARTKQSRVQNVNAVRRRDEHHGLVLLEAVHLDEQLVQGLLALIVAAAQTGATLAANGVDLVDEDDRRSRFLGMLEQVAHAACANAHEHFDEFRTRNTEERHLGLARDGARKQRFARARRAYEQAAARNFRAKVLVLLRVHEEVFDFLKLLDRLVFASDVVEAHIGVLLGVFLRLRLAKRHLRIIRLVHLGEEEDHKTNEEQRGQQAHKEVAHAVGQFHLILNIGMTLQKLHERILAHVGRRVLSRGANALRIEVGGVNRGGIGAKHALDLGIQRTNGVVVRIGRGGAGGRGRIIGARDGIAAGIVDHVLHAILLNGLHEFRGDERVGFGAIHHRHHLAADEHRHDEEQNGRNNAHALRRARHHLFGVFRVDVEHRRAALALKLLTLRVVALLRRIAVRVLLLALLRHVPVGVLLGLLALLRNLAKRRLRLALLLRRLRLLRLIFGSRRRRLLRLVVVLLVCFAHYFPWYTSGFRMPM